MRMIINDDTPTPEIEMYEVYDAFGNEGYSNTLQDQPFKFTGEPKDEEETDLVYLRARYYDPVIGRFITRDTLMGNGLEPMSLNRYSYAQNDPVNMTDPSGHIAQYVIGGAIAVGYTKLMFFDNVRILSDDGFGGETDQEWLLKVTMNTIVDTTSGKIATLLEPHLASSVFESYPYVGSKPNFPNPKWWMGVRARIAITQVSFEEYLDNLLGQLSNAIMSGNSGSKLKE